MQRCRYTTEFQQPEWMPGEQRQCRDRLAAVYCKWAATAFVNNTSETIFSFPNTTCRQINIQLGITSSDYPGIDRTLEVTVSVVQTRSAPQSLSVSVDKIGSLTARLDGGPWSITARLSTPDQYDVYFNGVASCATPTGE